MTLAIEERATPDDLLDSREPGRFELVDGALVEKPLMSKASNEVAGEFIFVLKLFLRQNPVARLYVEQPFMCFGTVDDPTRTRKPDVAVVLSEHVLADADETSFFKTPPDIAIEVLSPNDRTNARAKKVRDYEEAGVPLTWIADPDLREIIVRPAVGPIVTLRASDTLTAEPILPGFSVRVADLFPPAVEAAAKP